MQDQLILYGGVPSQSVVVEMLLAEAEIPFELRRVDITKGEHRTEAFLEINPAGFVPALITPEGEMLHENAAILLYLCERFELDEFMPPWETRTAAGSCPSCSITPTTSWCQRSVFFIRPGFLLQRTT